MPSSSPFEGFQDTLVQLPNKDLWRGSRVHLDIQPERADTIDSSVNIARDASLEGAMSAVYASAKGAQTLSCLWCGQQFPLAQAEQCKAHIAARHLIATQPITDEQALAALLAEKQLLPTESDDAQ